MRRLLVAKVMLLVLVAATALLIVEAQQSSPETNNNNATTATTTLETTTTTTSAATNNNNSETTTLSPVGAGETLLSGNEYVDFTETPTLLVDELSRPANGTEGGEVGEAVRTTTTTTTTTTEPAEANVRGSTSTPKPQTANSLGTTSTTSSAETTSTTTEQPSAATAGDEEPLEEELVDEDGAPRVAPFEPPKNVSQYMDYIERLFHDLRHQITDLFEPHIPQLIRTSQMVQLSGSCSYDMLRMALALRQFEPWALRMIDSSGKVPEGIFEGSFTALGSYDECLATVFASSQQQQQSQQSLTKGKYCLVNVSPYLPPKPPADRAERMFQEEANRRNYTKDDQFARLSPMFYYMKFRIGVCIPSTCLEQDLDSISSALSSSLRLNITIPHCRVNQLQPLTSPQLVGGLVFGLVLVLVLGATVMDYWRRKLEQMKRKELLVLSEMGERQLEASAKAAGLHHLLSPAFKPANPLDVASKPIIVGSNDGATCQHHKSSRERFNSRLERHWSWMSFSLLTNFKLYFVPSKATQAANSSFTSSPLHPPAHHGDDGLVTAGKINHKNTTEEAEAGHGPMVVEQMVAHQPIIRCLDGIRVLSLCWVIVANSYITLDPRATKRLTVTREAPKDFLFQVIVQASLAIETFFFLSGLLVSLSFARRLVVTTTREQQSASNLTSQQQQQPATSHQHWLHWLQFYVHRYIRMTPATMLVIAFTMFAFRFGDGPLWFEATHKAHHSCSENWWRHLLHVANFIDTRQMCFIHYWYIAADMQLFLFAPLLMFLLYKRQRIGYALATLIGLTSIGSVFYTTYMRNLPPTLLFYNSDPESRREYGNTIMTKPLTHVLPYMVGILVGKWLSGRPTLGSGQHQQQQQQQANNNNNSNHYQLLPRDNRSLTMLFGMVAALVALAEIFLPYKWNNSYLPTRLMGAIYASVFRLCWSLVLAYLVVSCAHRRGKRCQADEARRRLVASISRTTRGACHCCSNHHLPTGATANTTTGEEKQPPLIATPTTSDRLSSLSSSSDCDMWCVCGAGGSLVNRLLSLSVFTHLSKLSFVAYLIHLPLMSVFVSQTRGLFAFSHSLVIHLALSYLVMTFLLSFVLVHIIEFPFITFERYLFAKLAQRGAFQEEKKKKKEKELDRTVGPTVKLDDNIQVGQQQQQQQIVANRNSHTTTTASEPPPPPPPHGNSETFRISERL